VSRSPGAHRLCHHQKEADHEAPPYRDGSPPASHQGQREPIDFNGQCSDDRDLLLLPGALLDFHKKRFDAVTVASLSENVGAGARDVESHPIEGDVAAVTCGHAGPTRSRWALEDTVDDFAFTVSRARNFLAVDRVAVLALALLLLGGEEGLLHLVVEVLVEAPAPGHGDALVAAEHKAVVAIAALPALPRALHRAVDAAAGLAAAPGAALVVAVRGTRDTCRETRAFVRSEGTTGQIRRVPCNGGHHRAQ